MGRKKRKQKKKKRQIVMLTNKLKNKIKLSKLKNNKLRKGRKPKNLSNLSNPKKERRLLRNQSKGQERELEMSKRLWMTSRSKTKSISSKLPINPLNSTDTLKKKLKS